MTDSLHIWFNLLFKILEQFRRLQYLELTFFNFLFRTEISNVILKLNLNLKNLRYGYLVFLVVGVVFRHVVRTGQGGWAEEV